MFQKGLNTPMLKYDLLNERNNINFSFAFFREIGNQNVSYQHSKRNPFVESSAIAILFRNFN